MIRLAICRGQFMKRFVEGADRGQSTLLPECLDEWVEESNSVRVVDCFVDGLDLTDLGFEGVEPAATGRPAYHPSVLLKLYIYGYLNRVQSSRRLEREAGRNLEVIWLLGRLVPDDKVIADFRKDNGPAIRRVCASFVNLCRQMGLLAKASVAIDGSKFKAVNNRDRNFTRGKIDRRRAQLEESVARYLSQLDTADRQEPSDVLVLKTTRLKEKLDKLKEEMGKLAAYEKQMLASPDGQISLTDPDSRSMATRNTGRRCAVTGRTPARPAQSRNSAPQAKNAASRDGSMSTFSKPCSSGWIKILRPCAAGARRLSIPSVRSRCGWARRIS